LQRTAEDLKSFLVERREIGHVSTRHELLIDLRHLVDPCSAGILDVGAQAGIRGDRPSPDDVCLDEQPQRVADRGNRFVGEEELPYEAHRALVHSEFVRAGDAAGKHEAEVITRGCVLDKPVDTVRLALVHPVHRLDLPFLDGEEMHFRPRALERLARLDQLGFVDAVGGEESDLLTLKRSLHGVRPMRVEKVVWVHELCRVDIGVRSQGSGMEGAAVSPPRSSDEGRRREAPRPFPSLTPDS
jgi:hypothetical protein